MANDRLRDALMTARVTHEELADELGVHTKTVERWITQDRRPYPQFRHRISVLVQKDETWLWPDGYSRQRRGEIGQSEIVHIYPYRADVPRELWARLFENATENIGILVYSGFFLPEQHASHIELLTQKADDGASIRILLGDPDSPQVALKGQRGRHRGRDRRQDPQRAARLLHALREPSRDHHQAARHDAVQLDLLVRRRHAGQHPRLRRPRTFRPGPAPAAPQLRDAVPDLRPQL